MKKVLMLILTVTMVVALITGCTGGATTGTTGATTTKGATTTGTTTGSTTAKQAVTYPIPGNITLSYATTEDADIANVSGSWKNTPFMKAWQEQTGVNLEIVHYTDFSLLLASGDYPDIIFGVWSSYSGGATKAIEDRIIVPVEDYLIDSAPDYLKALDSNDEWSKSVKTANGLIPGFYNLRVEETSTTWGLIIRKDWLDDMGMDIPQTIDEYYNALVAFRDEKGAIAPLSMPLSNLRQLGTYGLITSPFDLVCTSYYQQNGQVHYGASEDAYKDVLAWLHILYQEGLLDKNVLTVDGTTNASNIMNGISGATMGAGSAHLGAWLSSMKSVNQDFSLAGITSLIKNRGDLALFGHRQDSVLNFAAVTTSCENIEAACNFLNYGYSPEGVLLLYYGIEGVSYEMKDGHPLYTDKLKNNSDGLSFRQALLQYAYTPCVGPYITTGDYSFQTYNDIQLDALKAWANTDVKKYYIPSSVLSIPTDSINEYNSIYSDVNAYVNEQFALFVTGSRPLNEFSDYQHTLKSMKIERMIEIYQKSLDEFNAR